MGAAASHSSPSLPTSCSFFQTKSTTRLFTVPGYSQWLRMPTGTSLVFAPFFVVDLGYRLRMYPARFDEESTDFVAVFLEQTSDSIRHHTADSARILIEILGGSGEEWYTVFDNDTARSEQTTLANHARGYVRFVKRRELEASSCVHDDSFTVQCTVSAKVEVTYPPSEVMEALSALSAAASSLFKPELCGTCSHTLAISCFSRIKAGLLTGERVHSTQFYLDGSRWYFKVYPNGRCDATRDCVSVFLGRGRSLEPATTAEFGFEIVGLREVGGKVEFKKHTFDRDEPEHGFPCSSDLASFEEVIRDDRVVVRQGRSYSITTG